MLLGHPEFSVQPKNAQISDQSYFFHMSHGKILLYNGNIPAWKQVKTFVPEDFQPFELAQAGDKTIYSVYPHTNLTIAETEQLIYHDANIFRDMEIDAAGLIASCIHLYRWYEVNRFCGRCGHPLQPDTHERALRCSKCNNLLFPTIAPAIIVAITCNDRILMARNQRYQHYALIAGYVEVGETLEHALRREVLEEVGLEIHDISYLGDQPWGISGSHMFAFHAHADDQVPIRIQESELKDARWFDRADVHPLPHKVSIAYEMIERFRKGEL